MTTGATGYVGAAVAGGVLVGFGVVMGWLIVQSAHESARLTAGAAPAAQPSTANMGPLEKAVYQAILSCETAHTSMSENDLSGVMTPTGKKAGVGGNTKTQVSTYGIDPKLSEPGRLAEADRVMKCRAERTSYFLTYESSNAPPPPKPATINPQTGLSYVAYVYYEEKAGKLTADGVFKIPGQDKVPTYSELKPGLVLRATSTARGRAQPTSGSDLVNNVEAGDCVKILDPAKNGMTDLKSATSGGWIHVQSVNCPAAKA